MLPDLRLGGGQVLLLRLIEQLDEHHEHLVIAMGDGDLRAEFERAAGNVHVVGPSALRALADTTRIARRTRPDIIHTNNTPMDRLCGQMAATINRRPVLNTFHSLPTQHEGRLGDVRRIVNRLLSRSRRVHYSAVSNHVAKRYRQVLDLAPNRVTVIHPGIDIGRFASPENPPDDLDRQAGDGIRFVAVNRLTPPKNTALLVAAMAEVRRRIPDARLLIVGDGPERPAIEQAVADLDLHRSVQLVGQRNDVPEILNQCDIFVTATELEGFGMAPVEAMACGLPVIACDIPVFREFLDDSVGRLVSPDDLASAMIELALDQPQRAKAAAAARVRAAEFSIERYAAAVASTYEALITTSTSRTHE
jgi:glycosyltransferase involved in cell wall biosynthesis